MSPFNLRKHAAKKETPKAMDAQLRDQNKAMGLTNVVDATAPADLNLAKLRKEKDNTVPMETQMNAARTGDTAGGRNIEGALNEQPKVFNEKRRDTESKRQIDPINLMDAARDEQHRVKFEAAEAKQRKDAQFWDKFIGVDLEGEKTKIPANTQSSQLENHPDRFKGIDKTMPIEADFQENAKRMSKDTEVDKMVTASLMDADAMLFHIYKTAASEGRETSKEEQRTVREINDEKVRILAQSVGRYKSDEDIAKEFQNFTIVSLNFEPAKDELQEWMSGTIVVDFPAAGESVGGGANRVADRFLIYDKNNIEGSTIGFDHWYPASVSQQLEDAIRQKASANQTTMG